MIYQLVKEPIVSLYKSLDRTGAFEDEVLYGMKIEVLESVSNAMVRIRTPYRYEGFVERLKLTCFPCTKIREWEQEKRLLITGRYVDILSVPNFKGCRLISLTRGSVVRFLTSADENGWVRVGLIDGRIGYCKESQTQQYEEPTMVPQTIHEREEEFREAVCKTACSYLGTQYRWGGKTPLGIDCSGLCSMSYMMNGVYIYRDAKIIEGYPVKEIPYQEKKKGDLLFFPGHVALYLGNGRYVHSTGKSGSDGVVENSLNHEDPDYREDLTKNLLAVGSIF